MSDNSSPSDGVVRAYPTAMFTALVSFGLVCVSLGCLFPSIDERLILTTPEVFSGLAGIRDILNSTASYAVWANPKGVDHVRFPSSPETQEELDDLQRRGIKLVRRAGPSNVTRADNPSLLHRLMALSWCSTGEAIPGTLPANRAPGCRCIANAYLALVNEAAAGNNASNTTVVSVPVDVRERVAARVYRCWDQRQVRRSSVCGEVCKTHIVGIALFANIVLFLVCLAFLFFTRLDWNYYLLKAVIVLVGAVLCIPFVVRYPEANTLNVAGVAIAVFYLTVSLHADLYPLQGLARPNNLNQLFLCLLQGLPLILSAHAIQLGLSGHGRDIWAILSFGVCGGLLGALLQARVPPVSVCAFLFSSSYHVLCTQRRVWARWYLGSSKGGIAPDAAGWALGLAYVCVQILLFLLFLAYRMGDTPYASGHVVVFIVYEVYLTLIALAVTTDDEDTAFTPAFTTPIITFTLLTVFANVGMTLLAVVDATTHV
jgi:hypothetical protein